MDGQKIQRNEEEILQIEIEHSIKSIAQTDRSLCPRIMGPRADDRCGEPRGQTIKFFLSKQMKTLTQTFPTPELEKAFEKVQNYVLNRISDDGQIKALGC